MPEVFLRTALICCSVIMLLSGSKSWAAPGVPVLPTSVADYVGYAVTNIPSLLEVGEYRAV